MAFKFSLEALLRLRATMTRQEEMRLEAISQQLGAVRHQRELLRQRQREFETQLTADLTRGTDGADFQMRMVGRRGLAETDKRLSHLVAELERAWGEQQQRFIEARRKQEVIETVKENQLAAYDEDQRRRQQQMVDDLFLSRYVREKAK